MTVIVALGSSSAVKFVRIPIDSSGVKNVKAALDTSSKATPAAAEEEEDFDKVLTLSGLSAHK